MALTFTTTKMVAPAQESCDLSKLDLLNATESLNQAWMDLTDAQREIDGLQEIMDNVTQSVELLTKFGADAIPMLNQDGGLESLLQIPERLITVEKAQEGLGEAAKVAWEKFKEWVKSVWEKIKSFFTGRAKEAVDAKVTEVKKVVEEVKSKPEIDFNKELTNGIRKGVVENIVMLSKVSTRFVQMVMNLKDELFKAAMAAPDAFQDGKPTKDFFAKMEDELRRISAMSGAAMEWDWSFQNDGSDKYRVHIGITSGISDEEMYYTLAQAGITSVETFDKVFLAADDIAKAYGQFIYVDPRFDDIIHNSEAAIRKYVDELAPTTDSSASKAMLGHEYCYRAIIFAYFAVCRTFAQIIFQQWRPLTDEVLRAAKECTKAA